MKNLRKVRAFTLIELIVVIVIIGILLALAAVGYLSFVQNSNKKASFATTKQAATIIQGTSATSQTQVKSLTWGTANGGTNDGVAYTIKNDGVALRAGANTDGVVVMKNTAGDVVVCGYKGSQVSSTVFANGNAPGSPSASTFDASAGTGSVSGDCPLFSATGAPTGASAGATAVVGS